MDRSLFLKNFIEMKKDVYLKKEFFVVLLISDLVTHFPLCHSFLTFQYTG